MSQQTADRKANSYSNNQAASTNPLAISEAIWQLPGQYIKVLCRPSAQTFREEMDKASWGIVCVQFYALIVISITLSYLAHIIPSSALHIISNFSTGSIKPFAFLPSPDNGIAFVLGSFLIGLSTAYLFSKLWRGQGRFLAHAYSLLLCTVPLVTISGALLLIPTPGSLVVLLTSLIFIVFVYRMVLHACVIMGVHGLSAGEATLIVLIIPMLIIGLAMLGLIIIVVLFPIIVIGGEALGWILEVIISIDWLPKKGKTDARPDQE